MNYNPASCNNMSMKDVQRPCIDRIPIAMAYVPWQEFGRTYDLDQALQIGTIFPELNKPFYPKGGNC